MNKNYSLVLKLFLLFGVFFPLISFPFISNYNPKYDLIYNITKKQINLYKTEISEHGCLKKDLSKSTSMMDSFLKSVDEQYDANCEIGVKTTKDCESCTYIHDKQIGLPFRYIVAFD